jgi:hypothetical protein
VVKKAPVRVKREDGVKPPGLFSGCAAAGVETTFVEFDALVSEEGPSVDVRAAGAGKVGTEVGMPVRVGVCASVGVGIRTVSPIVGVIEGEGIGVV